jgi:hypothetical protein
VAGLASYGVSPSSLRPMLTHPALSFRRKAHDLTCYGRRGWGFVPIARVLFRRTLTLHAPLLFFKRLRYSAFLHFITFFGSRLP